jgi:hypothetical protein
MTVDRRTADRSGYPDLVVVCLGMGVRPAKGIVRLLGIGLAGARGSRR